MTKAISYIKMNGLGNDFVIVDLRINDIEFTTEQIIAISDRKTGIGCDQFITIQASPKGADIFMRIYNQSGGEVEACGNATRCIVALLAKELNKNHIIVATGVGFMPSDIDGEIVSVDMGLPRFLWQQIPLSEEFKDTRGIELQIGPIDNPILHTPAVVNVGNPHAVFFVDDDPDLYDLERFGPMLENHPIFPERANISIAQITAPNVIKLRVWERGVGLTKACGTAACATAVCAARTNRVEREVEINLPGGKLNLDWREGDDHIIMAGGFSFDGEGNIAQNLLDVN